jgi:hypothetical protein
MGILRDASSNAAPFQDYALVGRFYTRLVLVFGLAVYKLEVCGSKDG